MLSLTLLPVSQLRVFLPRAGLHNTLISFSPFLAAALVAISRLEDYRHDVFDVVVGSCLGLSISYFSWRRYYPALSSPNCKEPFSAEADDNSLGRFGRIRDEEEMIGNAREFDLPNDELRYSMTGLRNNP